MDEVKESESLAVKVNGGKPIPKFGLRDRIGYAFGDFGTTLMMGMLASFSSIYVTNILGISPLTLSTLTLITTFLAMITDVTAVRLSDLTPLGKKGRFHPWIRTAKWFLGLSIIIIYMPFIRTWSLNAKIVYWFVANIFYTACLSSFNIPYQSLEILVQLLVLVVLDLLFHSLFIQLRKANKFYQETVYSTVLS